MLLTVALFVLGAGSVSFLLLWVHAPKIIRMSQSPALIGLPFPFAAAFLPTTGMLPFFDSRIREKQAVTKMAPPSVGHKSSLG
jgi:hypothetical protein